MPCKIPIFCLDGTMNTLEIRILLAKIPAAGVHRGVYASNQLPYKVSKPCMIVANTDPDTAPGTHWVAFFVNENGFGTYFDSFGRPPKNQHRNFIQRNCSSWTYNSTSLQDVTSSVCGQYCLVYLKHMLSFDSLNAFVSLFSSNSKKNDYVLKLLFAKYFVICSFSSVFLEKTLNEIVQNCCARRYVNL